MVKQAEAAAREEERKIPLQMREDDIRREDARWHADMQIREAEAQRQHDYRRQDREWRGRERDDSKSL
jgi:hypothetical protein